MSTTLPHGIIQINEGNISWYGDITANWQLIDSKIGIYDAAIATIPAPANNGTLTINYGGTAIAMFSADDAGNVSADIPAPGDGTLTIQLNGTDVQTFTANQSTAATANITVPTAVSELTNDSGYLTSSSNLDASKLTSGTVDIARLPQGALERLVKVANEAARYALTTADVQLGDTVQQLDTGIMYVVTDTDHLDSAAGYTEYTAGTAASVPWSGVTGKPTFAAVATSGAYSDLTGTPTIPTVNDSTLTIQKNGTNVATFTSNSNTDVTANISVPTKTSDLTNDSNFVNLLNNDNHTFFSWNTPVSGKLNIKVDETWLGGILTTENTTIPTKTSDLTNDSNFVNSLNNHTSFSWGTPVSGKLNIKVDETWLGGILTTENTTIPTKTSDLTNDSGFLTSADRLPIGSYIQFAGSQAPDGFLVCNGGAISRTTYSALFAVIGTTYGSGDGSTTFNLPNLTDRFLQGSTTSGTVKNAGLPNIVGSFNYNCTGIAGNVTTSGAISCTSGTTNIEVATSSGVSLYVNDLTFNASNSNSIYNNSATVQPPALTCLICIKY